MGIQAQLTPFLKCKLLFRCSKSLISAVSDALFYKTRVENDEVKALPIVKFLCSPSSYLQTFLIHLKKPCLDRLDEQQTPADKVSAETYTHCMLLTSGWSSVELFSSSS